MQKIAVIDCGGQLKHQLAQEPRRQGHYTELVSPATPFERLGEYDAFIITGGDRSIDSPKSPQPAPEIYKAGKPVLAVCYGMQHMAHTLGGKVDHREGSGEYGAAYTRILRKTGILRDMSDMEVIWNSHGDFITEPPPGFEVTASTELCSVAAIADEKRGLYGIQGHPEAKQTPNGSKLIANFMNITGLPKNWDQERLDEIIAQAVTERLATAKSVVYMSGGVDSTVTGMMVMKYAKAPARYVHLDTGFMRENESQNVVTRLRELGFPVELKDISDGLFTHLAGVVNPEEKRMIFREYYEEELFPVVVEGTLHPDLVESGAFGFGGDVIKTHHNSPGKRKARLTKEGGIFWPLQELFKNEVRIVGNKIGLAEDVNYRQPFPGPGLLVRELCTYPQPEDFTRFERELYAVAETRELNLKMFPVLSVGQQGDARSYLPAAVMMNHFEDWNEQQRTATDALNMLKGTANRMLKFVYPTDIEALRQLPGRTITRERTATLRAATAVVENILTENGLLRKDMVSQVPVILAPVEADGNGKETIIIRPVSTGEFQTARVYQLPERVIEQMAEGIRRSVGNRIGAVAIDRTEKPPGTIEWE